MKYLSFLVTALLFSGVAYCGGLLVSDDKEPEQRCPATALEWQAERDAMAAKFSQFNLSSNALGNPATEMFNRLRQCEEQSRKLFLASPELAACTENLKKFLVGLKSFKLFHSERGEQKMGATVPDEAYLRATSRYTDVPEDIKTNQSFLRAASRLEAPEYPSPTEKQREQWSAVSAALDEINRARRGRGAAEVTYFPILGNVPSAASGSRGRLVLHIPGNPEQTFSLGLANSDGVRSPQFSAVAVHEDQNGKKQTYFKDHWRGYDSKSEHVEVDSSHVGRFTDSCWKCHKSGPLLLPLDEKSPAWVKEAVNKVNRSFLSHGLTGSGGFNDSQKVGVGLGSGDRALREKLFPYCLAGEDVTKVDRNKVLSAMNCAKCHDGEQRGLLTPPFGDVIEHRIKAHGALRMPPGSTLDAEEKAVLARCLRVEYSGLTAASAARRDIAADAQAKGPVAGTLTRYLTQTDCVKPRLETDESAIPHRAESPVPTGARPSQTH